VLAVVDVVALLIAAMNCSFSAAGTFATMRVCSPFGPSTSVTDPFTVAVTVMLPWVEAWEECCAMAEQTRTTVINPRSTESFDLSTS